MMKAAVPFRCSCGALRGQIVPYRNERPKRLICYCDDCQAFAKILGRGEDVLDEHGGTDRFILILADRPLPLKPVLQAAKQAQISPGELVLSLPPEYVQTSVWLNKNGDE